MMPTWRAPTSVQQNNQFRLPTAIGPNFPLQMIGINGHVGIGQKHFERRFPLQRIARRLAEGIGGEQDLRDHRLFEPGKEGLDQRFGVLPAMRELGLCF